MSGITRRGFLGLAAGALVLRGVLRVSAEEGPRGRVQVQHPQYATPIEGGYVVSSIDAEGYSRVSLVRPANTSVWARTGSAGGCVLHPQGVTRDADGDVYVCDSRNGRIAVFSGGGSSQGFSFRDIGRIGFLPGQFHLPQGCAHAGSVLAVADTQNHRVQLINTLTGELERVIGRLGDGEGEFRRPSDVAFEDDETLWILDAGHGRALRYTVEGKLLAELVVPHGAQGLLLHRDRLVVSDTRRGRVLVLDRNGRELSSVQGMSAPKGLCHDGEDVVAVCESGADRVSVFMME